MDGSRQADELLMDAVEQMNLLEGEGETASSPQFRRARLEELLDDEQEKTGEDEPELIGPEDVLMTKSRGSPSSSTILEKLKSLCSLRRLHGKLKGLCSLRRLHLASVKKAGETASSTWDQVGALSTENEAGTGRISDGTRQGSSEDAKQPWHDEGGPKQLCIGCQGRERVEEASEHVHFQQDCPEAGYL